MIENKKPRTLVNIIGAPLLLTAIYIGGPLFTLLIFVIIFIGTFEFNNMIKTKSYSINLFIFYFIYSIFFFNHLLIQMSASEIQYGLLFFPLHGSQYSFFIFFSFLIIALSSIFTSNKSKYKNLMYGILAFVWIGILFQGAIFLRDLPEIGLKIVFCMFVSVWVTDSFAFIFGSRYGKSKILPSVSPNKTWVGFIAGYIACAMFIYFFYKFDYFKRSLYLITISDIIFLGIISGIFGQFGDFFESYLKRSFSLKDSGNLLQGHGGFLDRFDSLLFVAPLFYCYYYYFLL